MPSPTENAATETVDAIRLAVTSTALDHEILDVIRAILADGPATQPKDTRSVSRFLRAVKRTRRNRP